MKRENSAGAIVFRRDKQVKYLLLHYEAGHWDFPKGNIGENEKILDTIKREIEEETGIRDIEIIKGFKEKIHYFYKSENELISKDVVFYIAKTNTKQVKLSFEHTGFEWLTYGKALEWLTYKNAKEILKKVDGFLKRHRTLDNFY